MLVLSKLLWTFIYYFEDYSRNFRDTKLIWMIIGMSITIGTIVSMIPQILIIIKNRSGYGLSYITVFLTSFGQFSLVINVLCFNANHFIGFSQFNISQTYGTYITFANLFCLWFCYLFILFLKLVFVSKKENKFLVAITISITLLSSMMLLVIFFSIGVRCGFNSHAIKHYGTFLGTIASLLVYAQYLPQIITTFNMKKTGSLSLLTLEIQAPGGMLNALFMWIGQGQHWSTWISIMLAATQQFILLAICCYFSQKKKDSSISNTGLSVLIPNRSNTYYGEFEPFQLDFDNENQIQNDLPNFNELENISKNEYFEI